MCPKALPLALAVPADPTLPTLPGASTRPSPQPLTPIVHITCWTALLAATPEAAALALDVISVPGALQQLIFGHLTLCDK